MISFLPKKENFQFLIIVCLSIFFSLLSIFSHKIIILEFGSNNFELYSAIITISLILSNFFMFGTRSTYLLLRENMDDLKSYFITSSFLVVILSTVSSGILYFFLIPLLESNNFKQNFNLFFFFILSQSIILLMSNYWNALRKSILSKLVIFVPGLIFFAMLTNHLNDNFITSLSNSYLITAILFLPVLIKDLYPISFENISFKHIINNLSSSISFMNSNLIDVFTNRLSVLFFIYIVVDLHNMALFSIALSISRLSMLGVNTLNYVFSPKIADEIKLPTNNISIISKNMRLIAFLISIFLFFLFFLIGKEIIQYFYTELYLEAYLLILIMLFGQIINSIFNPIPVVAKLSGYAQRISIYKFILTIIMFICNYSLYDKFGINLIAFNYILFIYVLWNLSIYFMLKNFRAHSSIG